MDHTPASLSTHILDATIGGPRSGVEVVVHDSSGAQVGAGVSDERGRIGDLAAGLAPGPHRITWKTGGVFVGEVAVTVRLGEGHHHVPLLSTGASAMVYLGA